MNGKAICSLLPDLIITRKRKPKQGLVYSTFQNITSIIFVVIFFSHYRSIAGSVRLGEISIHVCRATQIPNHGNSANVVTLKTNSHSTIIFNFCALFSSEYGNSKASSQPASVGVGSDGTLENQIALFNSLHEKTNALTYGPLLKNSLAESWIGIVCVLTFKCFWCANSENGNPSVTIIYSPSEYKSLMIVSGRVGSQLDDLFRKKLFSLGTTPISDMGVTKFSVY